MLTVCSAVSMDQIGLEWMDGWLVGQNSEWLHDGKNENYYNSIIINLN